MATYAVVIHEDPAGGFWAEVPALPGCYSQGETVQELLEKVVGNLSIEDSLIHEFSFGGRSFFM